MKRPAFRRTHVAAAALITAASVGIAASALAHNGDDHTTPPSPGQYSSKAQAVEANLHDLPIGPLTVANWPAGPAHAVLAGSQHVVEFGVLESNAAGSYTDGWDSADASVASVSGGVKGILSIDLDVVKAECRADGTGLTGSSSIAGGTISVLGHGALRIPVDPPKNTKLSIPGLLDVSLNKQVINADGSLTVTALEIRGTALLQTLLLSQHPIFLTVAQANCDEVVPVVEVPAVAGAGYVGAGAGLAGLAGLALVTVRRRREGDLVA
jgi:hypothetical protein